MVKLKRPHDQIWSADSFIYRGSQPIMLTFWFWMTQHGNAKYCIVAPRISLCLPSWLLSIFCNKQRFYSVFMCSSAFDRSFLFLLILHNSFTPWQRSHNLLLAGYVRFKQPFTPTQMHMHSSRLWMQSLAEVTHREALRLWYLQWLFGYDRLEPLTISSFCVKRH